MDPTDEIPAAEFPFYRLSTIGWSNPVVKPTVPMLSESGPKCIRVDLSAVTFIDAFGVTYLAACIGKCLSENRTVWVRRPQNRQAHKYLSDVGLYDEVGLAGFCQASQPKRDRVDLVHIEAMQPGFVDHLLGHLEYLQPFEKGLRDSMRLALFELIQNFAEHSDSDFGAWVCGQFHKRSKRTNKPRLTLCILDLGKGIAESLRPSNPRFEGLDDAEILVESTVLGVSSASEGRGRGLDTIRRFVRSNGGDLSLMSGRGKIQFRHERGAELKRLDSHFPGSVVFLSLEPSGRGLYILD